jgi:hypothetical protein
MPFPLFRELKENDSDTGNKKIKGAVLIYSLRGGNTELNKLNDYDFCLRFKNEGC